MIRLQSNRVITVVPSSRIWMTIPRCSFVLWRGAFGATIPRTMTWPRRASRGGSSSPWERVQPLSFNIFYFFFAVVNKPLNVAEMVSWFVYCGGSAITSLERSSMEQRGWRARERAATGPLSSSRPITEGPRDWTSEWDPYRSGGDGMKRSWPAVRPNGERISRSVKDLGEGTRFGLASRADPNPKRIAEVPRISVNSGRISARCIWGSKENRSRAPHICYWGDAPKIGAKLGERTKRAPTAATVRPASKARGPLPRGLAISLASIVSHRSDHLVR